MNKRMISLLIVMVLVLSSFSTVFADYFTEDLAVKLDEFQEENTKEIEKTIKKAIKAVERAENAKLQKHIDSARELVNELPESEIKIDLQERLDILQAEIDGEKPFVTSVIHDLDDNGNFYRLSEWGNLPKENKWEHFYKLRFKFKNGTNYLTVGNPIKITLAHYYNGREAEEIENFDVIIYRANGNSGKFKELLTIKDVPFEGPNQDEALAAAIAAAEAAIAALPSLEDIRIPDKGAVEDAQDLVDVVKAIDPDAVVEGEELLAELLAKIIYLEEEAEDNYYRLDIYLNDPVPMDRLNISEVLFEGYVANVKYFERILIDNREADIEFVENAVVRDLYGDVVYTGPAYKFNITLELDDGYHLIPIKAESQSGKSSSTVRRFYTDTTPPELTVTVLGVDENGETELDSVELEINIKDNFGGIVLYEYYDSWYESFGDTPYQPYNQPVDETITYTWDLDVGENWNYFRLKDAVGWWAEDVEVIVTRVEPEPVATGNVQISLLKDASSRVDFDLIKDSFYIKNKITGEEFTEGNYLSSTRKDIYQMKDIPVGEYTIHYELPDGLSTKKLQLGSSYKETDYDAETNPLVVEELGPKNYNYVKITIEAEVLLKEVKEINLELPQGTTLEEFMTIRPNKGIIIDENDVEHEVDVTFNPRPYAWDQGLANGYVRIQSQTTIDLPLYVSNTEPAMSLWMYLNITFVEPAVIESLEDPETVTVEVDEEVEMPVTVTANMSDGTQEEVAVTWNPEQIDTSTPGTKTAVGTVEDFDGTVTFTVIVNEPVPVITATAKKRSFPFRPGTFIYTVTIDGAKVDDVSKFVVSSNYGEDMEFLIDDSMLVGDGSGNFYEDRFTFPYVEATSIRLYFGEIEVEVELL